jgi:hypothetical protein
VNGRLDGDADLDLYRLEAKAGDRLAFLVYAARLQHPVPQLERDFSDIAISLHDAAGAELAAADDSLTEDPEVSYSFQRPALTIFAFAKRGTTQAKTSGGMPCRSRATP